MPKQAYIIGLTGNIASGKSFVRQVLQNYGALTIDADLLAQRTYQRNSPAYAEIITEFGPEILGPDSEIDRRELGRIVFSDPGRLRALEEIVHPHTLEALEQVLLKARTPVILIEMIKLFEIGMDKLCDSIWICTASDQVRAERLIVNRHLSPSKALERINSQPPQPGLLDKADAVINTEGIYTQTCEQIDQNLNKLMIPVNRDAKWLGDGMWVKPVLLEDVVQAAEFLSTIQSRSLQVEEVFSTLGSTSLMGLWHHRELVGLINWKIANFICVLIKMDLLPSTIQPKTPSILRLFKSLGQKHLCEILAISADSGLEMDGQRNFTYTMPAMMTNRSWQSLITNLIPQDTPVYIRELPMCGRIVPTIEK